MGRQCLPVLLAAVVAGLGACHDAALLPPLRSEHGRRLSLPALHEAASSHGFELRAVHLHRLEPGALVHVRHPVAAPPGGAKRARRLASFGTRRDVVRTMLALSAVAYPAINPYYEATLQAVIEANDSIYGPGIHNYTAEIAASIAALDARRAEVNAVGNYSIADGGLGINTSDINSTGCHAVEFYAPGFGTVLSFRGSYSSGDYDNIKPWILDWILTRMDAQMKNQWLTVAGLDWTPEMRARELRLDQDARLVLQGGGWYYSNDFFTRIGDIASQHGVDPKKAQLTGYWEFTKMIADSVRSSLNLDVAAGEKFTITGHSQGGSNAQLVSMYLEKKYGVKYDTITFASTGSLCFSRKLAVSGGNMLDDLNPYVMHDQVTDYVHPLDIYGSIDYDAGKVCTYGKTGIAKSTAAKWCAPVYGNSGPALMLAGSLGFTPELVPIFERCRYQTHIVHAMRKYLLDDAFLFENGTTDGGCETRTAITKEDAAEVCPTLESKSGDVCSDELSAKACLETTTTFQIKCSWCPKTAGDMREGTCRSKPYTWVHTCDHGWANSYNGSVIDVNAAKRSSQAAAAALALLSVLGALVV